MVLRCNAWITARGLMTTYFYPATLREHALRKRKCYVIQKIHFYVFIRFLFLVILGV